MKYIVIRLLIMLGLLMNFIAMGFLIVWELKIPTWKRISILYTESEDDCDKTFGDSLKRLKKGELL